MKVLLHYLIIYFYRNENVKSEIERLKKELKQAKKPLILVKPSTDVEDRK
jgi:hypothetical protein